MPDATLLALFDQVRGKTLELLRAADGEHALWAPPGLHNSLLWHAGHSYVVVELLMAQAMHWPTELPAGWYDLFSWESRPTAVSAAKWPPLLEVIAALEQQHRRLRVQLAEATDDQLAAEQAGRAARDRIVHALHDEACHCGEMWLLLKMKDSLEAGERRPQG